MWARMGKRERHRVPVYDSLHRIKCAVEAAERHMALRGITGVGWRNDLDGVGEGGGGL